MEGRHKRHPSLNLWQAVMNAGKCVTGMRIPSFRHQEALFLLMTILS